MHLDPSIKRFYRENGAALVKGAFTPEHLELLARGIERNIQHPSEESYTRYEVEQGHGAFIYDYGCHPWIPEYIEFAKTSGLAKMAAELLDSQRVCFFDDSYFIKESGSQVPAPWHHDFTYYQIEGEIVVAWIPLDPHGEFETLRMVAGSHRWGREFLPVNFDPAADPAPTEISARSYEPVPDIDGGDFEILAWEVEPGDCVFFHGLTLHGSRGNPTQREQRRFSCRFLDESAVYAPRAGYPWGDGKANSNVRPGQRLSDDPEIFPVLWEGDASYPTPGGLLSSSQ